jgi:hypothetical protein
MNISKLSLDDIDNLSLDDISKLSLADISKLSLADIDTKCKAKSRALKPMFRGMYKIITGNTTVGEDKDIHNCTYELKSGIQKRLIELAFVPVGKDFIIPTVFPTTDDYYIINSSAIIELGKIQSMSTYYHSVSLDHGSGWGTSSPPSSGYMINGTNYVKSDDIPTQIHKLKQNIQLSGNHRAFFNIFKKTGGRRKYNKTRNHKHKKTNQRRARRTIRRKT